MALTPNVLQRDRVQVLAADTGDRYSAPTTNEALQLASSLQQIQPDLSVLLGQIAASQQEEQAAQAKKDALANQGQTLADAVRAGKLSATRNPWYMEAYAKEGAAIRAQSAFSQLQLDSASWAERNDPAAFNKRWNDAVGKIAEGFTSKDEISGFLPVQNQFTQQALQSNVSQNVQRIETERKQNNGALAADAIATAAAKSGGQLSAEEALAAAEPAHQMWIATGGSEQEWRSILNGAITSSAYSTSNAGLLDLKKAIGLDGKPVLDGKFGNGPALAEPSAVTPTPGPQPLLAGEALPAKHALPVQGGVTVKGGEYGAVRASGEVHHGLDLAVPEGTPVVSPGVGTVVAVGHDAESGNFVRVDHGGGIISSYAHLSAPTVQEGQQLAAGAQLGLSGSTGKSTGPHLHWRVRVDGHDVNPRSVAFPQGQGQPSFDEAFANYTPPADNPQADPNQQAPEDATQPATPQPQIARGPSLYDIGSNADSTENDRRAIVRASEEAITARLRNANAALAIKGREASDYLYSVHGTDILLGKYDTPALVKEMTAKGYSAQVQAVALANLHEATSSSAGVMSNQMRLQGSDPQEAKAVLELGVEGARDGYSAAYQQKVEQAVIARKIDGPEGERMIQTALSRTHSLQAEARAEASAARAQAAASPGIHKASQLREAAANQAEWAASQYAKINGSPPWTPERQKIKGIINDAVGAYMAMHPGDYDGGLAAGQAAAADYARGLVARKHPGLMGGTGPTANPRAGQ